MKSSPYRIPLIIVLILMSIGCDQSSKYVVRERVNDHERIEVLGDYLILTKEENPGAFLGLGSELPQWARLLLLTILPSLVLIFAMWMALTRTDLPRLALFGLALVAGGGLGNVFDRIYYGTVTDFLHIDLGFVRTGIFNAADMCITTGISLILVSQFIGMKKDKKEEEGGETETPAVG